MVKYHLKRLVAAKKSAPVDSPADVHRFAAEIAKDACKELVETFETIAKSTAPSEAAIAVAIDRFQSKVVDSLIADTAVSKIAAPVQHGAPSVQKSAPLAATPRSRPLSDDPLTRSFARTLGVRDVGASSPWRTFKRSGKPAPATLFFQYMGG